MTDTSLVAGSLFHGRYQIVACLKSGGMGSIFEVADQRTGATRALKVLQRDVLTDKDMRARFEREAMITAQVESDHIVRIFRPVR